MASFHIHEDEPLPPQTTPQGTQDYGVLTGHEERDIDIGALGKWAGGLALWTIVLGCFVAWGVFIVNSMHVGSWKSLPPMLAEQPVPPMPRMLPNRWDAEARKGEPVGGPIEYREQQQKVEEHELAKAGLFDEATGLAKLPEDAVQAAIATSGGATAPPEVPGGRLGPNSNEYWMPSEASGGVNLENRQR